MGILAWLASLEPSVLHALSNSLPSLVSALFGGGGSAAATLLSNGSALATNALGDLGRREYLRAQLKGFFGFVNALPASEPLQTRQQAAVSLATSRGAIRSAVTDAWLCLGFLQPIVDDAEASGVSASIVAAQGNRDAVAEYVEVLDACEEAISQGVQPTVPAVPAIVISTLASVRALPGYTPVAQA